MEKIYVKSRWEGGFFNEFMQKTTDNCKNLPVYCNVIINLVVSKYKNNITKNERLGITMKKMVKITTLVTAFCVLGGITANASYTTKGYNGDIKTYHGNTRLGYEHRSTSDTSNPWRVSIKYSGEGKGTITTFWLENFYGTNVSADIDAEYNGIYQYYASPYSKVNESDVYLTAENNNYNNDTYQIRGYWSEEDNE